MSQLEVTSEATVLVGGHVRLSPDYSLPVSWAPGRGQA